MSIQTKSLGAKASLSVLGSPERRRVCLSYLCYRRVGTEDSLLTTYVLTKQLNLKQQRYNRSSWNVSL